MSFTLGIHVFILFDVAVMLVDFMNNNAFLFFGALFILCCFDGPFSSGYEPVYRARGTWGRPCTQELLAFESVDISECLGMNSINRNTFPKAYHSERIEQRERDRIPKRTRQSTAWSVNVYPSLGWIPEHTNWNPGRWVWSVPVDLGTTPVER